MGDSVTPLLFLLFSTILNIGLDLLFIVSFHWGVAGAAIATVAAQVLSAGLTSDYYRTTNGTYVAHLMVKEGNSNLIELSLDVPLEEQAKEMCSKWKDSSQDIYEFIMQSLM